MFEVCVIVCPPADATNWHKRIQSKIMHIFMKIVYCSLVEVNEVKKKERDQQQTTAIIHPSYLSFLHHPRGSSDTERLQARKNNA